MKPLLLFSSALYTSEAFVPASLPPRRVTKASKIYDKDWGIGDDWNKLSEVENEQPDVQTSQFATEIAAYKMQSQSWDLEEENASADPWLTGAIDSVLLSEDVTDPFAEDYKPDINPEDFLEDMGREIALLVRCNQSPEEMLIAAGKALPPLDHAARNDIRQLIELKDDDGDQESSFVPTSFLKSAVKKMFESHSTEQEGAHVMDARGVASWMMKSLNGEPCGPHDPRVTQVISRYGDYGSGVLQERNLLKLYVATLVGQTTKFS